MNIFQRAAALFGRQYVVLRQKDDEFLVRCARRIGPYYYARVWELLPETAARLLPNGKLQGRSYLKEWEPLTVCVHEYFHSGDA